MSSRLPPPPDRPGAEAAIPAPALRASPVPAPRRRHRGIWVGLALFLLGGLVAALWLVVNVSKVSDRIDGLYRAEEGEPVEFSVEEPVTWTLFAEPQTLTLSGLRFDITDVETGRIVEPRRGASSFSYSWGSRSGRSIGLVDLDPGDYRLEVEGLVGLAVGPSPSRLMLVAIGGAILLGGGLMLAGTIVGVVSAVKDTRRRNQANEPPPPSPWSAGEWPAEPGR